MLKIKRFTVNPLQENCYVVSDETKEGVVIDCGAYTAEERNAVTGYILSNGITPKHLILTHGHIDHCIGCDAIYKAFGLRPEAHLSDQPLIERYAYQSQAIFGEEPRCEMPPVERYFTGKDTISFGSHELEIIETPGHSPGGVFFYCRAEKTAFSGDTLFRGSIGRTDFMGGSMFHIIQSLRMICQMDDDTEIYPGHGQATTIGYECATNMYLDR